MHFVEIHYPVKTMCTCTCIHIQLLFYPLLFLPPVGDHLFGETTVLHFTEVIFLIG